MLAFAFAILDFFVAVLFLVLSNIALRSTVKGKELPAQDHYHQASGLHVENSGTSQKEGLRGGGGR